MGRSLHQRAGWMHQQPPPSAAVQPRQGHSHIESMHDKRDRNIQAAAAKQPNDSASDTATASAPSPVASSAAASHAASTEAAPSKGPRYYLSKIKAMLQHYTLGAKLLWKNTKKARAIRKKSHDAAVHTLRADWRAVVA